MSGCEGVVSVSFFSIQNLCGVFVLLNLREKASTSKVKFLKLKNQSQSITQQITGGLGEQPDAVRSVIVKCHLKLFSRGLLTEEQ